MVGGVNGRIKQIALQLVEEVNSPSGVHVLNLAPVVVVVTVRVKVSLMSPVVVQVCSA